MCPYRRPQSRFSLIRPRTCVAARTSPPRTVATRRTRPITGVGDFGKEKCGDGRARRNIPPRTGNEPVAGDASETAMLVGTHLSQQTPPEECMTGVREGDAKLCRRGSSFDGRHFPIAKADASRDETFFQLFAKRKADRVSRFFGLLALSDGKSKQCFFSSIISRIEQHTLSTTRLKKKASKRFFSASLCYKQDGLLRFPPRPRSALSPPNGWTSPLLQRDEIRVLQVQQLRARRVLHADGLDECLALRPQRFVVGEVRQSENRLGAVQHGERGV